MVSHVLGLKHLRDWAAHSCTAAWLTQVRRLPRWLAVTKSSWQTKTGTSMQPVAADATRQDLPADGALFSRYAATAAGRRCVRFRADCGVASSRQPFMSMRALCATECSSAGALQCSQ